MIPKKIHFIFGLRPDFSGRGFCYHHYLNILTARNNNPDYEINLFYLYHPGGEHFDKLKEANINLIKLSDKEVALGVHGITFSSAAHVCDYKRLEILKEHGGIYFDCDMVTVQPLDKLLNTEAAIGVEHINNMTFGLPNYAMLSVPNSKFINDCLDGFKYYDPNDWSKIGVRYAYEVLYEKDPFCVNVFAPEVFTLYGWDDASRFHVFHAESRIRGAYGIHLWESRWRDALERYNSYDFIKNEMSNTLANIYLKFAFNEEIEFPYHFSG